MDIFSHIVAVILILSAAGYPAFIPFGILGAVILDFDMILPYYSDRNPSLYLFTHGGFTHSLFGAVVLSVLAFAVVIFLAGTGVIRSTLLSEVPLFVFLSIIGGASLHIFLDYLASPGIPVFYPLTEKKYGLGIFPIPVFMVLTMLSLVFLVVYFFQNASLTMMSIVAALFSGIVVVSACIRSFVRLKTEGRIFTTPNPARWLVISEDETSYLVQRYHLFNGITPLLTFDKYRNITPSEVESFKNVPELKRHQYFSYISIAEKDGSKVTFHDPLREQGLIAYPPSYAHVTVSAFKE